MIKILIIEDESDIRETLKDVLTIIGYDVYEAENGQKGILIAKEIIPDLIICDIMMPIIDGYGVLSTLRKNPLTFSIPFLFLTARSTTSDRRFGMELGADDYITKPFNGDEIIRAIETRLEKSREIKDFYKDNLEDLRQNIASSLPHELRTPLTIMMGFAQMIKSGVNRLSKDDIKSMAENIYDAGNRLFKLIIKYTHYSELLSIEKGDINLNEKIIDADRVIVDTAVAMASMYDKEDNLILEADRVKLKIPEQYFAKLIEELVENSLKFSDPETKIIINGKNTADKYIILFENSGREMRNEEISRIGAFVQFERKLFEQQGAGLGLAIVKKTCEIFNGSFNIKSEDSITKVIISFPI